MVVYEDMKLKKYGIVWNKERDSIHVYTEEDMEQMKTLFSGVDKITVTIPVIEVGKDAMITLKSGIGTILFNVFDLDTDDLKSIYVGKK